MLILRKIFSVVWSIKFSNVVKKKKKGDGGNVTSLVQGPLNLNHHLKILENGETDVRDKCICAQTPMQTQKVSVMMSRKNNTWKRLTAFCCLVVSTRNYTWGYQTLLIKSIQGWEHIFCVWLNSSLTYFNINGVDFLSKYLVLVVSESFFLPVHEI